MAYRILFMGTPDFAVPGLKELHQHPEIEVVAVVTQPDRPGGRGKQLLPPPVKLTASSCNIPVIQPESIKKNYPGFLESVKPYLPIDIAVVIAFGQILPLQMIQLPRKGCLNIHASLLPRWRGAAPIQRSLLEGDRETGVCLMQIEEGLDSGPVFARASHIVRSDETAASLHDILAELGAGLLKTHIVPVIKGDLLSEPQAEEGVTYARKIEKAEAQIDWNESAIRIERQIRGFNPYPAALTSLGGKRLKIFSAKVKKPLQRQQGVPGEVVLVNRFSFEVWCGEGSILSVTEVQIEGKKRMGAEEFLKGVTLEGVTLGDGNSEK